MDHWDSIPELASVPGFDVEGWYSYDLLDNQGVPSAERIIAAYQHLEVRDKVLLTPDGKMGYPVAIIEPGRALVLSGTMDTRTGEQVDPKVAD